jgi:hypothetical protein
MKQSKFWEAQITFILLQLIKGTAAAEVCRKLEISDPLRQASVVVSNKANCLTL